MTTNSKLNNTDYLLIMAPVNGWDILDNTGNIFVLKIDELESVKMGKPGYLNKFEKVQVVMARQLVYSIFKLQLL